MKRGKKERWTIKGRKRGYIDPSSDKCSLGGREKVSVTAHGKSFEAVVVGELDSAVKLKEGLGQRGKGKKKGDRKSGGKAPAKGELRTSVQS